MSQELNDTTGQEPNDEGQEPNASKLDEGQGPKIYDEATVKKLREEAAASRVALREAESKIRDFENQGKTELERLQEQLAEANKTASVASLEALRYKAAANKNVPLTQAHRLTGSTLEELEADAESFLADLSAKPVSFDAGAKKPAETNDMDAILKGAFRAQQGI